MQVERAHAVAYTGSFPGTNITLVQEYRKSIADFEEKHNPVKHMVDKFSLDHGVFLPMNIYRRFNR
jgi:hypothetical protein